MLVISSTRGMGAFSSCNGIAFVCAAKQAHLCISCGKGQAPQLLAGSIGPTAQQIVRNLPPPHVHTYLDWNCPDLQAQDNHQSKHLTNQQTTPMLHTRSLHVMGLITDS
jgi:hypothetical protein